MVRVVSPQPEGTNELIKKTFPKLDFSSEELIGKLILISPSSIRIRSRITDKL